jgi:hypothetical protein
MSREDAAKLLDLFRSEESEPPSVDPGKLAHAYLLVLGSLHE